MELREINCSLPDLRLLGSARQLLTICVHADTQGVDYFSLPKASSIWPMGRSAFAAFDPPLFGPHLTWHLLLPALVVWLESWLSLFEPMTSYAVYTLLSLGMMAICAWLIARQSNDPLTRHLVWLLIVGAFPTSSIAVR